MQPKKKRKGQTNPTDDYTILGSFKRDAERAITRLLSPRYEWTAGSFRWAVVRL